MGERKSGSEQNRRGKKQFPDRQKKSGAPDGDVSSTPFDGLPFMSTKVELLSPEGIYLPNRRLRRIPEKVKERWRRVIHEFGFLLPLLVNSNYELLHGEAAYLAALDLRLRQVPVIRVDHLNQEQQAAYRIWLNKAIESEEWDEEALIAELQEILLSEVAIDLTGFSLPEVDALLYADLGDGDRAHLDQTPDLKDHDKTPVRVGDVWLCAPHVIVCGDARDVDPLRELLGSNQIRLVLTDPPYNIPIKGVVSGAGAHVHREFVMGSKDMSGEEFQEFLREFLRVAQSLLMDGGLIYCFMDWRSIDVLTMTAKGLGLRHMNTCVWKKTNGGMGGLYRSAHELIGVFKYGNGAHLNNVQLGKHGRNRTNVWEYEGCNSINPDRRKELADHPTPKPVALLVDSILDVTNRGDLVFDPFLGSGSTLIAAQETDRVVLGVELDPIYVDVTLRRWLTLTGEEPVHAETGLTYSEMVKRGRPASNQEQIASGQNTDAEEAV
ncbi:MAG: DNA modification methylase [Parvibaculum sp.]